MENTLHISGSLKLRKLEVCTTDDAVGNTEFLVCSFKALLRMPVVTGFSFHINKIVKRE